ncbi:MAG: prepilin-type N-terminal cleavage/methylation domain-containing protein [Phycisphaeraceae bacterium]|nr:prepilin-type N-terminal cleavage/methylation domain-containing protein [Phycisphaeraceae bacterium]
MTQKCRQSGFSLTEVLLAIATLAIGMLFIGGTFMLGIHFSRVSTEQSISPVVAEEAFAKMSLYGVDGWSSDNTFSELSLVDANDWEYQYPSINDQMLKQYYWTAIGRRISGSDLNEVTVFVMRQGALSSAIQDQSMMVPPQKSATWTVDPNIMNGMNVISDDTGELLRASVVRGTVDVTLWPPLDDEPTAVWFMEPSDGRNPCVAVFQRKIRF